LIEKNVHEPPLFNTRTTSLQHTNQLSSTHEPFLFNKILIAVNKILRSSHTIFSSTKVRVLKRGGSCVEERWWWFVNALLYQRSISSTKDLVYS